ncbi:MAG: transposase [Verrucomicrobiota bacterium]|nr:transposase [Verrucomicrobiota bacterium]
MPTRQSFLEEFMIMTRKSFSREAAFNWFVIVFVGLTLRSDCLGVTSIIRGLDLSPVYYESLLHFFHATSWNGQDLLLQCVRWLLKRGLVITKNGKIVINGDETKVPKEGRRIPLVGSIRQTSETSSKPSYFRGHEWSMLGILIGVGNRVFCSPAWADIMVPGAEEKVTKESQRTTGIVKAASELANKLGYQAYLTLDAFYASGTVLKAAYVAKNVVIITRAKSNLVAHVLAPTMVPKPKGRPKKYLNSVKLKELHETKKMSLKFKQPIFMEDRKMLRYIPVNYFGNQQAL